MLIKGRPTNPAAKLKPGAAGTHGDHELQPADIQALADIRWAARSNKDWATSDKLRDELAEKGWTVKDGKDSYQLSEI